MLIWYEYVTTEFRNWSTKRTAKWVFTPFCFRMVTITYHFLVSPTINKQKTLLASHKYRVFTKQTTQKQKKKIKKKKTSYFTMPPSAIAFDTTMTCTTSCDVGGVGRTAVVRQSSTKTRRTTNTNKFKRQHQHQKRPRLPVVGVRFSPYDEVIEIPHINDLSDDEINDVWMSRKELTSIRRRAKSLIKLMDLGSVHMNGLHLRGLDQNTPTYTRKREAVQQLLHDTVHQIQYFRHNDEDHHHYHYHRRAGYDDDDVSSSLSSSSSSPLALDHDLLLAEICQKVSNLSTVSAIEYAKKDELEVLPVVQQNVYDGTS